jgi:zinc/manganese transport system permease protein
VVLNLVGGFHALGTLMAVGMVILPAATARFWAQDITRLILVAVITAMLGSMTGLLVSYHAGLPSGPAIILAIGVLYLASLLFAPLGVITRWLMLRWHLQA